ncbi:MAG: DUF420 domain-containing protein [Gemmatimonadetes bacterium]|nr:DUF420 domain-containing protein [Gemmatimonadota bacterium]
MTAADLPDLNAGLNTLSALFLGLGYFLIRRGRRRMHMRAMLAALFTSALFLCSYLFYHWTVGSVPYPHHDWTRWLYFAVLIPHAVLATVMVPFILLSLWHAYRRQFRRHARITRWVWPVWMYVSLSGVVVYAMLYRM